MPPSGTRPRGGSFFLRLAGSAVLLAAAGLARPGLAPGGEGGLLHGSRATVVFPDAHRGAAREILDMMPSVREELEQALGWSVRFKPKVVLVAESGMFRQMTGRTEVVALAVPGRDLILIDLTALRSHPFDLASSLKHEMCHLLLHARIPEKLLPRWLDEGVAQWVSGGLSEIRLPRKRSLLDQALLSRRTIPLARLSAAFRGDGRTLLLAYEQSLSLVRFLVDRFGVDTLTAILNSLAGGTTLDRALSEHCSMTPDALEQAWLEDMEDKMAWTSVLIAHLYELLFVSAAAVLVIGFVRHARKKRAAMQALDDPDEGSGPPS